ncbi:MAG: hypothetical protein AB8G22_11675, partial [Saprospiraceae bacterium]
MSIRKKFLLEFLLSIGLVFSLSQFFFVQTFFLEERLQSVSIIALLLSGLLVILTAFRYVYLVLLAKLQPTTSSPDMRKIELRLPIAATEFMSIMQTFPKAWQLLSLDETNGTIRFRRPLHT